LIIEHNGGVSPENYIRYQFNAFEKMTSALQFFFMSWPSWLLHACLLRLLQHTPAHLCIDIQCNIHVFRNSLTLYIHKFLKWFYSCFSG